MLVLARKLDERIIVGDDIVITVVQIKGDLVRLGIHAPADVAIDREEIRLLKDAEDAERRAREGGGR